MPCVTYMDDTCVDFTGADYWDACIDHICHMLHMWKILALISLVKIIGIYVICHICEHG